MTIIKMSNKNKVKSRSSIPDGDNEPYHHPILEEQMIIRFPADIAAKLNASMEDEEEPFKDFKIRFIDKKHAIIKLFGEELSAVLVSLPTIVETHRTVDGSHLFKSADIGEILIVHRPNAAPDGISEDYVFEHGLTPPTLNIVSKRKAKQEAARNSQPEGSSLDGIQYWEMVEIQLAALLSKEKTAKPICRQEFLEEPDVDPQTLEKILRRNNHPEFKGYSGTVIDESEISVLSPENEPVVHIPAEIVNEIAPDDEIDLSAIQNGQDNQDDLLIDDTNGSSAEDEISSNQASTGEGATTDTAESSSASEDDAQTSSSSYEEEEEEEEEDETQKQIKQVSSKIQLFENQLIQLKRQLMQNNNPVMKEKLSTKIEDHESKIAEMKAELAKLKEKS
ncbi:hypothetical protein TRFO_09726 [Tritrichomonas foetus]|uniref:TAFII55 protein conserved region domain-containing protein n=1 Tax=Tritrichomonas foetus TaxID=1144522 RepID=A0A1J4JHX8_9EUKA|nr:hypothetical protein TRFO_09726 [Tritrichomonas foetus]|eukprot:OHS96836.1 hypothetical protein TRFO_09726 [Tritrichomonas foetus]